MKRIISLIIVFTFCCSFMVPFASALNITDNTQDEEIERLFYEISELVLQENTHTITQQDLVLDGELDYFRVKREALDEQLEELGVHKIDPNYPSDLTRLSEIVDSIYVNSTYGAKSIDEKPNVSVLATKYSIYETSGNYTLNGTTYPYSYYRFVDDKGTDGLIIHDEETTLLGPRSISIQDLLNYNFSFGISSFLGSFPYGSLIEWTLGNIFTALESYNGTTSFSSSKDMYILVNSVTTQMMYYFLYDETLDIWIQAGSSAPQVHFKRTDFLAANVAGVPEHWTETTQGYSSTGMRWSDYYRDLINNGRQTHSEIGYLTIQGIQKTGTIRPKYYSSLSSIPY